RRPPSEPGGRRRRPRAGASPAPPAPARSTPSPSAASSSSRSCSTPSRWATTTSRSISSSRSAGSCRPSGGCGCSNAGGPSWRTGWTVPGLMHVVLGGYHVHDVEVVAAFDVDAAKVGLDIGKAIFSGQNNTIKFASVGELGVEVQRAPTLDGLGKYYRLTIEESLAEPVDVAQALRDARADVLVSYLPVGSEDAQRHYANACIEAGVAFVNAIPV